MEPSNQIVVPMYNLGDDGSILPNLLFHRPWDKLHSRCVEYPFAASKLGDAQIILDVGTAKADKIWIEWLASLPIEVHATDYDKLEHAPTNIVFHHADVRSLVDISDNFFDKILAVSVIEHIGLENPQVHSQELPAFSNVGDDDAFRELVRVLKKGGEIVMTFPFGKTDRLILGNSARNYTINSIKRFEKYAWPVTLDYYEYQYSRYENIYLEHLPRKSKMQKIQNLFQKKKKEIKKVDAPQLPQIPGAVTWRRIPVQNCQSTQLKHVDGVLCGVWVK